MLGVSLWCKFRCFVCNVIAGNCNQKTSDLSRCSMPLEKP